MTCVITDRIVLSRAPEGPLAVYVRPFADFLSAQGYGLQSIHRQVHLAACFSRWLQREGVALPHMTAEHAKQY
jgi:integrase/recombinase XerD